MIEISARVKSLPGYPLGRDPRHQAPAGRGGHGRDRSRRRRQRHAAAADRHHRHERGARGPGVQQVRLPAGPPSVPAGGQPLGRGPLRPAVRPGHGDPAADRLQGRAGAPAVRGGEPGRRDHRARAGLPGLSRRVHPRGGGAVHRPAAAGDRLPPGLHRDSGGGAAPREGRVRELPEQPDGRGGDAGVSRALGGDLPAPRDPPGLRQRVLRPDLRRVSRAQHLRDPRRATKWRWSSSRSRRASR